MAERYFSPALFTFLKELGANNNREWFQDNKARYEDTVKDPALRFIADFGPRLKKISPHFRADPRANGGSMFRIYRDTRFSKDKTPYKTFTGIQFRHELGKTAHAPGFYLHLQPGGVFAAVGSWHPDGSVLRGIREAIVEDPAAWRRSVGKRFQGVFDLQGESLKRPPKGFDPEHAQIDDLKRKDFIGVTSLPQKAVTSEAFMDQLATTFADGGSLVRFICRSIDVPY
jgi:uncharacterized protein (TIGR02453 family)